MSYVAVNCNTVPVVHRHLTSMLSDICVHARLSICVSRLRLNIVFDKSDSSSLFWPLSNALIASCHQNLVLFLLLARYVPNVAKEEL